MKKNVIITGAAGNLGMAVTRKFLESGYHVYAILSEKDDPDFLKHAYLSVHTADLINETEAIETIDKIINAAQEVDAAIMIVGGFSMATLEETSLEDFEKMFRLNFVTAYNTARPVFIHMKKQDKGGQLVFIGARPAVHPVAAMKMVGYALSKSLVFRLSEILNEQGKEKGIISSVIVPSVIDTPGNRKSMPDTDFSKWVTPEEIADNIHHLFSPSGRKLREPVLKVYGDS